MIDYITLDYVCDKTASLPCAPDLVPQLMQMMKNPEVMTSELAKLLSRDSGTTAAIIRVANSAYFRRLKCNSLDEAILRLGSDEIYRIVTAGMVSQWMSTPLEGSGFEPAELYAHAFAVGVTAEVISTDIGGEPKIAYTAGLLHDIGKLGMAHACGKHLGIVRKLREESNKSWRELELEVFGFDHTQVSAALLRRWLFPPSLVQVVEFYPRPRFAGPSRPLVLLVHAAKNIALNQGFGTDDGFQSGLDEELLIEGGYTPEYLDTILPRITASLARINT